MSTSVRARGKAARAAVGELLAAWRDEIAAGLGADAKVAVVLYRWRRILVTPLPRAWWPWGFEGGWRHPLSGWLLPEMAHGGVALPAVLATDDGHGEGFPGLAWGRGRLHGEQVERRLPDPGADGYAARAGLPEAWLERVRRRTGWLPRSQYGFLVEVAGRPYGVVVVEASTEDFLAGPAVRRSALDLARKLERALGEKT